MGVKEEQMVWTLEDIQAFERDIERAGYNPPSMAEVAESEALLAEAVLAAMTDHYEAQREREEERQWYGDFLESQEDACDCTPWVNCRMHRRVY